MEVINTSQSNSSNLKKYKNKTFRDLLWSKPIMRVSKGAHKASFLELFFDLSIVAAVGTIAHMCGNFYTIGPIGWLYWILGFYAIFSLWVSITTHLNKFTTTGIKYRFVLFLTMVPLALMTAGIIQTSTWYLTETYFRFSPLFFIGFIGTRLIISALFLEVYLINRKTKAKQEALRIYLIPSIVYFLISLSVLILTIVNWKNYSLSHIKVSQIIMLIAMIMEFFTDGYKLSVNSKLSIINKEHLNERFGLFFIIALGEAMISSTISISKDLTLLIPFHENLWVILVQSSFRIISCFLLLFLIWWLNIDKMPNYNFVGKGRFHIIIYVYLNFMLLVGIMMISFWFWSERVSINSFVLRDKWTNQQRKALEDIQAAKNTFDTAIYTALGDRWKSFPPTNTDVEAIGQIGGGLVFFGIGGLHLFSGIPSKKHDPHVSLKLWIASLIALLLSGIYCITMGALIQHHKIPEKKYPFLILPIISCGIIAVGIGVAMWSTSIIKHQAEIRKNNSYKELSISK